MKKKLFKLLRYSGLPYFFREFIQKNKVTILMFHDISRENAEATFKYLSKNYNLIDLNTFIEAYHTKDNSALPKKALIITFDDGHLRNYDLLPVIKEYKIPVTIFLCSHIVNTNRHYWFMFENIDTDVEHLKNLSNDKRLEKLSSIGFRQDKEFNHPQALQKEHIEEMSKYVNFQSHTMFHPILPNCTDEIAKEEIFDSKRVLENTCGFVINSIAFPNGDYNERDLSLVKKAEYKCAITVDFGFNSFNTDIFRLKRVSSNDTDDINELIVKSSGAWLFFKTLNGKFQNHGYKKSNI